MEIFKDRPDNEIYLSIYLSTTYLLTYGSTVLILDLGIFVSFLIHSEMVGLPGTGDQPVARPLRTHRTSQTE
jgi:hypothetical protein